LAFCFSSGTRFFQSYHLTTLTDRSSPPLNSVVVAVARFAREECCYGVKDDEHAHLVSALQPWERVWGCLRNLPMFCRLSSCCTDTDSGFGPDKFDA
jgi:hypothetical protein